MTLPDLKVIRGQTPPGGFFERFTPKSGWVNGGRSYGPPYRTIFAEIVLKRSQLDAGCRKLGLEKIKFADFELQPPKVGGHIWVKA